MIKKTLTARVRKTVTTKRAPTEPTKKMKLKRLSRTDLSFFKEKLINIKEETLQQMQDISQDTLMKSQKDLSGDISGYGLHMADVASDNYEREFNLGIVSNERKVLLEIEEALKRIEEKTYGVCLGCNKLIAKKRLNAIPHTRYCTKCQNKIENGMSL